MFFHTAKHNYSAKQPGISAFILMVKCEKMNGEHRIRKQLRHTVTFCDAITVER
jgi:hypothetical protein